MKNLKKEIVILMQYQIIDTLDQDHQNQITMIMAEDYEIEDLEKAIDDIIQAYKRDKLNNRKLEILELLEKTSNIEEKKELEKELSNIIITLARIKQGENSCLIKKMKIQKK